jgi:hypothetical protein
MPARAVAWKAALGAIFEPSSGTMIEPWFLTANRSKASDEV